MKTKNFIYAAFAGIILASCSSNDFAGDQNLLENSGGGGAISFGFDVPTPTRASGATAATKLNNQFIVYAEKNESGKDAPTTGNLVFPNYKVTYGANTAYTTTSNTKNWEYVGLSYGAEKANIKMGGTAVTEAAQTIKYWDYAATSYTFTAVSAKPEDITNGRVVINKLTSDDDSKYEKGYTVTLSKTTSPDVYPSLADLYFSDRNVITQGTGKDRTAMNAYGGNVTFTFRNALSQVRAGVYETIPGYAVTAIKFYVTGGTEAKVSSTSAFGVIAPNIGTNYEGTLTVTYYDNSDEDTENHPKLSFTGTPANDLILGTNMSTLSTSNTLGTTSASPTWDTNGGTFTSVLPQIDNTTNMKLKVDYTLYNSVTGETINITGKTAEVPGKYLAWKPNFKYTYLFKITDDELYPITFDAVTIEAEDGTAEYITTVTEPSITTFGVKDGKYSTGSNEYTTGTDIYVTIVKDNSVVNPVFMSDTHLYKVTTSDATNFPITEASVAEAFENPTGNKITVGHCICTAWKNAGKASKVTSVPAEDGTTIAVNALKFSPASGDAGTYAVQYSYGGTDYTYTALTADETSSWTSETSVEGYYVSDGGSGYTEATGTYDPEKTYYDRKATGSGTKRAYKIIKVQ